MPRQPRKWIPNATYHFMMRGNRKSIIFHEPTDFQNYLNLLDRSSKSHPFRLHSFCLMNNHIHLLLETMKDPPTQLFRQINTCYAMYYNKKYDSVGHLFQGRFKAKHVDTTSYLLGVSKYIHLNPVEANLVKQPELYPWSSYSAYYHQHRVPLVHTEKILSFFPESSPSRYNEYVRRQLTYEEKELAKTFLRP
ncbi:transposase [Bacillus sp. SCS-153A]|uniref:transposase n=1 Tax=Rossellomorea sedimentorum TaxID=3115294 RepID=UPI00390661E1